MNINCWVDAGYNNHTKSGGYGSFLIKHPNGEVLERFKLDDVNSSNEAEYKMLELLLEYLLMSTKYLHLDKEITFTIKSDSRLIINQMIGLWKTSSSNILPFTKICKELKNQLESLGYKINIMWIHREENVKMLGH